MARQMLFGSLALVASGLLCVACLAVRSEGTLPRAEDTPLLPPTAAPLEEGRAREVQKLWAIHLRRKVVEEVDLGRGVKMQFVLIPPGAFRMGSPPNEDGHTRDEKQHTVNITRPFYLGKHEVTQEQYQQVMGTNPSYFSARRYKEKVAGLDTSRFPVEDISWHDAQAFCARLSRRDGRRHGLPTEAEWEHACRAGTTTAYFHGNDARGLASHAWFSDNADKRTHEVGTKKPNPWGLHDMCGNVWEWTEDWHDPGYGSCPVKDPRGPTEGTERVVRGGDWHNDYDWCRSATRYGVKPTYRGDVGFRVAFRPD